MMCPAPNRRLLTLTFKESVCTTFGCGLSSACVVDVGDEKTSICCVEEGVVIPSTRYRSTQNHMHTLTLVIIGHLGLELFPGSKMSGQSYCNDMGQNPILKTLGMRVFEAVSPH